MRRWISYLILVIAAAVLASVPAVRSCQEREIRNPRYHAALYWAHIQVVDTNSKQPIDFETRWDYEALSPFIKGYGPSVVETLSDRSKVVIIVGELTDEPLVVTLTAPGYQSKEVTLPGNTSGLVEQSQENALQVITLQRVNENSNVPPPN